MPETSTELLELVLQCLPSPEQIRELDLTNKDEVRFTWRGTRFRISDGLYTEEVQGSMLASTNTAMLLAALLRRTFRELT